MLARPINGLFAFFARLRQRFRKRPDQFLNLLREQAQITVSAADGFRHYLKHPGSKAASTVRKLEKEADEVNRILIAELNRTFATPFDREDIQILSRVLDDMLDELWATVNEMEILGVEPNSYLKEMARLLEAAPRRSSWRWIASRCTRPSPRCTPSAPALTTRSKRSRASAGRLFRKPDLESLVEMMKLREVYRHLFHASNRVVERRTIEDILVKFF